MRNISILMLCLFSLIVLGQNNSKRIKQFNVETTLALQGYDPVAYFKVGKAFKGKNEIIGNYEGISYYFTSKENKEEFLKNPQKYEP